MKIKKKVFKVYLTTGETITLLSEKWDVDYSENKKRLAFQTGENIVAIFMLAGICGFEEEI